MDWLGWRLIGDRRQLKLQPGDVVPRAELPAHAVVRAARLKAHGLVQANAGIVWKRDPGARQVVALAA